jgi:anti-anti-sigma regulatory factor
MLETIQMIHISETTNDDNSILVEVDGRLDRKSLASLKAVCDRQLSNNKKVFLHLKGITHTDESGREYIKNLKNRVEFLSVPEFLKLEINLKLKT